MKKTLIFLILNYIIFFGIVFNVNAQYSNLGPGAYCTGNSSCASGTCLSDNTCACCVFSVTPNSPCLCPSTEYCNSTTFKCIYTGGTGLAYGSTCTSASQCSSNFCQPLNGTLTCLCTQNSHCPTSTPSCNTTTNQCYAGQPACTANWQCNTQYCNTAQGICASCTTNTNCSYGRECVNGNCVVSGADIVRGYGENCQQNSDCESSICRNGTCGCSENSDCYVAGQSYQSTCVNGTCVAGQSQAQNSNCWIRTQDSTEFAWQYENESECRSECQSFDCQLIYADECQGWCCISQGEGATNVSCSGSSASSGGSATIPNPLKCEDIPCVVDAITSLITSLVTVLGTIMIIIGGIQYISSAGSEDKARRAKNTVLYAVIGIAIAISVDFIVGFLREILSRNN